MIYIKTLRNIIEETFPILEKMSAYKFGDKPLPEKWSHKEIIGHLIDSAFNNHRRIIVAENQDNLLFDGYDQVQWVKRNNYQSRDKSELINLWRLSNLHFAESVLSLPDEKLNAMTTVHSFYGWSMIPFEEGKSANLVYLVADYVYHLEHHLSQILPDYKRKVRFSKEGYFI